MKEQEKPESEQEKQLKPKKTEDKTKPSLIFVEIDDEVTQVCESIRESKDKDIILIIPKEAVLFQSVINLKIIKQKSEELKKSLKIVTKDEIGLYLARQSQITASEDINDSLDWKVKKEEDQKIDIQPINATANTNVFQKIKKFSTSKKSIFEVLKEIRQNEGNKNNRLSKLVSPFKKRPKILSDHKLSFSVPNTRALSTLILMSVGILIISAYIILPGSTIYITPKADVISQSTNIILAESTQNSSEIKNSNRTIIPMYFYETDLSEMMTYYSSGKVFEGSNASGVIRVYNRSNNPWTLINNTRLQTSDGIVFRTKYYVTIPPQNADGEPGILDVEVVADEEDIFTEIVGARGNIEPSQFFLPGLNDNNQKLLYGESFQAMSGGLTQYREIVTEDDIFAAEQLIKEKLLENMKSVLEKEIVSLNEKYNTNFYLLLDEDLIETDQIKVIMPENLVDQSIPQFDLSATMHVKVPYFNHDELVDILKTELNKHTNPKKILVKTYEENLQFEIMEIDERNQKIKITATLQGLEEFNLSPENETGQRIIEKIKNNVAGKSIDEANNYIQNLPEINKVEIQSWPKWAIAIPNVPENIKIKVVTSEN